MTFRLSLLLLLTFMATMLLGCAVEKNMDPLWYYYMIDLDHKIQNQQTTMNWLIAGYVVLVGAAIGLGIYLYNQKKKQQERRIRRKPPFLDLENDEWLDDELPF